MLPPRREHDFRGSSVRSGSLLGCSWRVLKASCGHGWLLSRPTWLLGAFWVALEPEVSVFTVFLGSAKVERGRRRYEGSETQYVFIE